MKIVGDGDVDHLATTSGYSSSNVWFLCTFAKQLVAYTPSSDRHTAIQVSPDLAEALPTPENGGITEGGLVDISPAAWRLLEHNSTARSQRGRHSSGNEAVVQSGEPDRSAWLLRVHDRGNAGLLRRVKVREAIAWAIDKKALVQNSSGPRVASPARQAVSAMRP